MQFATVGLLMEKTDIPPPLPVAMFSMNVQFVTVGLLKVLYQTETPPWVYEPAFQALDEHLDKVLQEGTKEEVMRGSDSNENLDRWLAKHGGTFDDYAFIPLHSRYRDAFVGLRKSDRSFVDIVEIPPPR